MTLPEALSRVDQPAPDRSMLSLCISGTGNAAHFQDTADEVSWQVAADPHSSTVRMAGCRAGFFESSEKLG